MFFGESMKKDKVYKHNKLNNAGMRLNGSDYKVYLSAIALVKNAQNGDNLPNECTLSAKEFSESMKIDLDNAYKILKSTADKLVKNQIVIEKPELFEIQVINIVDSATYNKKQGTIKIEFTKSLMEYLKTRDNNYTIYNLQEIADLTSIYAIRLYELIQQYKTTGFITKSIEQLRQMFKLEEHEYKLYADLKRKVIGQAVKEICEKTDFSIEITEFKESRKVVALQFNFNKMLKIENFAPNGEKRVIFRKTKKFGETKQKSLF
jgi:plasmid replication initiation protein